MRRGLFRIGSPQGGVEGGTCCSLLFGFFLHELLAEFPGSSPAPSGEPLLWVSRTLRRGRLTHPCQGAQSPCLFTSISSTRPTRFYSRATPLIRRGRLLPGRPTSPPR